MGLAGSFLLVFHHHLVKFLFVVLIALPADDKWIWNAVHNVAHDCQTLQAHIQTRMGGDFGIHVIFAADAAELHPGVVVIIDVGGAQDAGASPQSSLMRTTLVGDRDDEGEAAFGMSRSKYCLDFGVAKFQLLTVDQEMVYRQVNSFPWRAFWKTFDQFIINFGKIDFCPVFFFKIIGSAVVVAVAMGNDDGTQLMQVQSEVSKTLFDDVDAPLVRIHAVDQHQSLRCFQHKAADDLIPDKGQLVKKACCRADHQVLFVKVGGFCS